MEIPGSDPSPSPTAIIEEVADISPGLPGFVVTFILALAVLIIVSALVRSLRRVTVRAKLEAETEAEGAGAGAEGAGVDGTEDIEAAAAADPTGDSTP